MSTSAGDRASRAGEPSETIVARLRQHARSGPRETAYTFLEDGEQVERRLTYGELDRRASAVARGLCLLGQRGQPVLLLLPPGEEFLIALFGAMYAGALAVPAYPPLRPRQLPRLEGMIRDSGATLAVTTSRLRDGCSGEEDSNLRLPSVGLTTCEELESRGRAVVDLPVPSGSTPALLQYTSGSTGDPKGILLTHDNLRTNQEMLAAGFRTSRDTIVAGWLPTFHDMGLIGQVLHPAYLGATCVLMAPTAFVQRPARWLAMISRFRATVSGGPNFAYDLCLDRVSDADCEGLDLSCWQVAFNGAEPVRPETIRRFVSRFSDLGFRPEAFYPCYGLAEATLFVSGGSVDALPVLASFEARALEERSVVPAEPGDGRALAGCGQALLAEEIAIVDPETRIRCAPTVIGEVWVRGGHVAAGYRGRSEETRSTFAARIDGEDGTAFLRTGDLGFFSQGELFIAGRIKDLLIVRGRNYYPQDLEVAATGSHEALVPGACAAFTTRAGAEDRLVVVVEVRGGPELDTAAVIGDVRAAVASEFDLMVHEVVLIRARTIPKTSSGKIRRRACRQAHLAGALSVVETDRVTEVVHDGGVLPGGGFLSLVARTLRRAESDLDPARSLLELGIDSLKAIELSHLVEQSTGAAASLSLLLSDRPLREVERRIAELPQAAEGGQSPPTQEYRPGSGRWPLTHGQAAVWLECALVRDDHETYHLSGAAMMSGPLDRARFEEALRALIVRHGALRTSFEDHGGTPVQVVHAAPVVDLEYEQARGRGQDELAARMRAEAGRAFDLATAPLLRVRVYSVGDQEHALLVVIHHAVSDFLSIATLLSELDVLYSGGAPPEMSAAYPDFVEFQREFMRSEAAERAWSYWKERLAGHPATTALPADHERPDQASFTTASASIELDASCLEGLTTIARDQGTTLFSVLLAAFKVLIGRCSGQDDLVVGTPVTGRPSARFRHVIGYFVNPVPLRTSLAGNPRFSEYLRQVSIAVVGALEHQHFPFPTLVQRLGLQRERSRVPLVQTMFTLQQAGRLDDRPEAAAFMMGDAETELPLGDLRLRPIPFDKSVASYDLAMQVCVVRAGLKVWLQYDPILFEEATIESVLQHYRTLIEGILLDVEQAILDIPIASDQGPATQSRSSELDERATFDFASPPRSTEVRDD